MKPVICTTLQDETCLSSCRALEVAVCNCFAQIKRFRTPCNSVLSHANAFLAHSGPDLFVAVDETYLVKKKKQAGGFHGRFTPHEKTVVLGAVELKSTPTGRRETGRALLKVIPNKSVATMNEEILCSPRAELRVATSCNFAVAIAKR